MKFVCPKSDCPKREWPTAKAWKAHLHRAHGGYTSDEWKAAAAGASSAVGAKATGFESFEAAKAAAPMATLQADRESAEAAAARVAAGPAISPAMQQLAARFSKSKDSMAKALGVLMARGLEHWLKLKQKLPDRDVETISEGWGATLDCLDVVPAFSKREIKLTSPLWAMLFPCLACLLVAAQQFDLTALLEQWEKERERDSKSDRGDHRAEGERKNPPGDKAPSSVQ